MSSELIDLRAKITELTDDVLDCVARSEGRDKSELVRDVLHSWASQKAPAIFQAAKLLEQRMRAKGTLREHSGNGDAGRDVGVNLQLEQTGSFRKSRL